MDIIIIVLSAALAGATVLAVLWRREAKLWEGTARALSRAWDSRQTEQDTADE